MWTRMFQDRLYDSPQDDPGRNCPDVSGRYVGQGWLHSFGITEDESGIVDITVTGDIVGTLDANLVGL